jgi:hypothetical protein
MPVETLTVSVVPAASAGLAYPATAASVRTVSVAADAAMFRVFSMTPQGDGSEGHDLSRGC